MPLGIIGSLLLCTVIYVVVAAVFSGLVPYPALVRLDPARRAEALAVAMEYVQMPGWAVGIVALGSVVAQTAVLLVFQLGQPRILFAMARDGLLPPVFARVHPRVRDAARLDDPHGRARRRRQRSREHRRDGRPDEHRDALRVHARVHRHHRSCGSASPSGARPFRVPFGPILVPALGLVSCLFLVAYLPPTSWLRFVGWLLAGLVIYGSYGFRRSRI